MVRRTQSEDAAAAGRVEDERRRMTLGAERHLTPSPLPHPHTYTPPVTSHRAAHEPTLAQHAVDRYDRKTRERERSPILRVCSVIADKVWKDKGRAGGRDIARR